MGARHRSANFIVDNPDPAFAKQVCDAAETYRRELAVSWTGKAMPNWSQPCLMTVQDGPRLGNGGATTFVFDRGEVFGWRMTIQGSRQRLLDSVLPHEITHTIFASRFRRPLPRWADEGGATSVEHASERNKYNHMLYDFLRNGRGIAFNRMFAMSQYPGDIMPLYAQGHSVATYLIETGGRPKFLTFLADGMETDDWSTAIRRHYRLTDAGALQNQWLAWVRQGSPPIESKPQPPAEMLAAAGAESTSSATGVPSSTPGASDRRPRPEPNLIYRGPTEHSASEDAAPRQPRAYAPGSVIAADRARPPRYVLASRNADGAAPPGQVDAKSQPGGGWRLAGTPAAPADVTPVNKVEPIREQLTRPQPIEHSRQIILEWQGR
jgi:hypothetical protein